MGYLGVKTIVESLQGKKISPAVDTGVVLATAENLKDPTVAALLPSP
jgi:ribose transport system substrate-binding protein